MFSKLPVELQNIILDYTFECKKTQNFYVNKEITKYVSNKKKCRSTCYFNKNICYECNKEVLKQIDNMFLQLY